MNLNTGSRKSKSTNLWSRFIIKAFDLLKDNGYVAMITPSSWASNTVDVNQGKIKIFKDIFNTKNPIALNISTVAEHFNGIGSTFSYFVVQNTTNQRQTKIITSNDTFVIDTSNIVALPKDPSSLSVSINKKFMSFMTDNKTCQGQYQSSDCRYSSDESNEFSYPAYHTHSVDSIGKTWYTNVIHPNFHKKKVIFSLSGYFNPKSDNGTIGYTDMCLAYILKPNDLLDAAYQVFSSKLYRFFLNNNKWSGFNPKEVIRSFPILDFSKTWTDQEIFQYFGLTPEEIEYIEANV